MQNYLSIKNLTFKFNEVEFDLFSNFNLKIGSNHPVSGLLGRNGAGKTVLAKILTGLIKPESGTILYNGEELTQLPTSKRIQFISMTIQQSSKVFFTDTVSNEIAFTIEIKKKIDKNVISLSTVKNVLDNFHFMDKSHQRPLHLSGGEKRKLNYMILSILSPKIIIFDEPTIGFDFHEKQEFVTFVKNLVKKGHKIIIITHNISLLLHLTNHIIILSNLEFKNSIIGYQGSLLDFYSKNYFQSFSEFIVPSEIRYFNLLKKKKKLPNKTTLEEFIQSNYLRRG